jgi:hypothetical protein
MRAAALVPEAPNDKNLKSRWVLAIDERANVPLAAPRALRCGPERATKCGLAQISNKIMKRFTNHFAHCIFDVSRSQ